MKNILLAIGVFLLVINSTAQSSQPVNSLNIAVYVPDSDILNASNKEKLKSKMIQFLTKSGFGSDNLTSASFLMYPKIDIVENFQLDAGTEPQQGVVSEITFIIKQIPESKVFGSTIIKVKGVGKTKDEAFRNSFSTINTSDPSLVDFVKSTREKIVKHYTDDCDVIIAAAETEFNKKNISKAIFILAAIPSDAKECYFKVQDKIKLFYQAWIDNECQQMMIRASAASGSKDYNEAFSILGNIPPNSKCYNDAKTAIEKTKNQISKEEAEQYNRMLAEKKMEQEKELAAINAAKEVAKEYYKSQKMDFNLYVIK